MPAWGGVLSDADIAALVTYLREKEGKPPFTPIQVNQVRVETSARNSPWTVQDLANLHIH
jgi:mono/diheme cytochrome c family protein